MRNQRIVLAILSILYTVFNGCSRYTPKKAQLEFSQDAYISYDEKVRQSVKTNETFDLSANPILVESPGHISLLVVPLEKNEGKAQIKLRPINSTEVLPKIIEENNKLINEVLAGINAVQSFLAKNQPKDALSQVNSLISRFPKITYLKFLKASCHYVVGDKALSKTILQEALKEHPDNIQAQELYDSLVNSKDRKNE